MTKIYAIYFGKITIVRSSSNASVPSTAYVPGHYIHIKTIYGCCGQGWTIHLVQQLATIFRLISSVV